MALESISAVAEHYRGIVVVDEAYVHFSSQRSMILDIGRLRNLVVLQTFSKAWGMAGLRVGLAFADSSIVELLNRVKPPYNVSGISRVWSLVRCLTRIRSIGGSGSVSRKGNSFSTAERDRCCGKGLPIRRKFSSREV